MLWRWQIDCWFRMWTLECFVGRATRLWHLWLLEIWNVAHHVGSQKTHMRQNRDLSGCVELTRAMSQGYIRFCGFVMALPPCQGPFAPNGCSVALLSFAKLQKTRTMWNSHCVTAAPDCQSLATCAHDRLGLVIKGRIVFLWLKQMRRLANAYSTSEN